MVLLFLGLAAVFIATYFAGRTAREYGRSSVVWVLLALVVGFGLQFVIPIFLVFLSAVVLSLKGTSPDKIQTALEGPATFVSYFFWVLSIVGSFLVLKLVSRLPQTGIPENEQHTPLLGLDG